jgi:hypothetical protein
MVMVFVSRIYIVMFADPDQSISMLCLAKLM